MSIQDAAPSETEQTMPEQESATAQTGPSAAEAGLQAEEIIELRAGSLDYTLVQKLQALPYDKQREVMDFVEFLAEKNRPSRPRRSFLGALAHLNIPCSEEDIAEARREMWGNFPREFPDG
jgi:hypothetical protein